MRGCERAHCHSSSSDCSAFCDKTSSCSRSSDCTERKVIVQVCRNSNCAREKCLPRSAGSGTFGYSALVMPANNIRDLTTSCENSFTFHARRQNQITSFQWNSFSFDVGANGIAFVSVNQSLDSLPASILQFPIRLSYKGQIQMGFFEVNPFNSHKFAFYFNLEGSGQNVSVGDHVIIYSSSVSWINTAEYLC